MRVKYAINAPDRAAVLQRVDAATADGAKGLTEALAAAGVPLHPAVFVNGVPKVTLAQARAAAAAAAPVSTARDAPAGGNRRGVIIGAVLGSVFGAVLLGALAYALLRFCRARRGGGALFGGKAASPAKKGGARADDDDVEMVRDKE